MSFNELIAEALELPEEERRRLAQVIESSLSSPDREVEEAWIEEAVKRVEAYRRGELELIPPEDVFGK